MSILDYDKISDRIAAKVVPFSHGAVEALKAVLPSVRKYDTTGHRWMIPSTYAAWALQELVPMGYAPTQAFKERFPDLQGLDVVMATAPQLPGVSVGQLVSRIQKTLAESFEEPVWVRCLLIGYDKTKGSKFLRFQMVEMDEAVQEQVVSIDAVMSSRDEQHILGRFRSAGLELKDRLPVLLRGRPSLWTKAGRLQFIVDDADPAYTKGRLALDLESLYRQLGEEGLVGRNTKLPWPSLPMTIGLVSTSRGEGCHDFQATLARSGFPFDVQIVETVMQGENTTRSVLKAMAELRSRAVDVIAIIRGGGAAADLNWFNTYELAKAVCEFPVPVLIGLGHERDQTILDRVGWSHKTPSAAAEALVKQILSHVGRREQRAAQVFERVFRRVDGMEASLERGFYRLAQGHHHLMAGADRQLADRHHTLGRRAQLAIAMSLKRQQDRQREFWLSSSRRLEIHQARLVSSERLLLRQLSGKVEPSWHRLRAADTVLALMHARLVSRQEQLQDRQRRLRLAEEQRFGAPRQHMDRLTHGLLTAAIRVCRDADRQSRDRDDRVRRVASLVISREDLKGRMIRLGRAGRAEFQQWARALSAEQKRLVSVSMRVTKIPFTGLDLLDQQFRAHDPLHQLARGFAIVTAPCGRVVRSSEELVSGERVSLRLVDGVRHAIISDINAESLLPAIGGSHAQADS